MTNDRSPPAADGMSRRRFVASMASAGALAFLSSCTGRLASNSPPRSDANPEARSHIQPPPELIAALKSDDPIIKADAARLLGDLRSRRAVPALIEYVISDRHYSKTSGLEALAQIGCPTAIGPLRSLIAEPNCFDDYWWYGRRSVQVATVLALVRLGDIDQAEFLIDNPDGNINWALISWFSPTVLRLPDGPPVIARLKASLTLDRLLPPGRRDPGQVVVICDALGLMSGNPPRDRLMQLTEDQSRYVRARAAMNLATSSDRPEHLQRVAALAETDPAEFVRISCCQALASLAELATDDAERYADAIARMADTAEDAFDRAAALDSLGVLRRHKDLRLIRSHLRASDPYERLCAVAALGQFAGTAAVNDARAAVVPLRDDDDERVRLQAAASLARLA
jgi:HEAT repeat protein